MRKTILVALTVAAALMPGALSYAKPPSKAQQALSKLKKDCGADIQKYCADITPGEGRIASCLNSREDQLSPQCSTTWDNAKAHLSQRIDKAGVEFRKSCGADVQKYCSNVPSGKGRLLSCLDQHRDSLSGSCQKFQAKLNQRVEDYFG